MRKIRPLEYRFFEKVEVGLDPDNCWHWTGAIDPQTGYGRIGLGGRDKGIRGAHQVSFEIHDGFLPDGHEICHTCNHRWCVNPLHLYAGTRSDNVQDMIRAGTHRGFENGVGVSIHDLRIKK